MKLYFSPGACALASQIALREAGVKFDMVKVDLAAKKTADGGDYKQINPKGYVPALQDDSGEVYTEGAVILQRIADQAPDKKLLPKMGTKERYHAMEWLNFIATELHKGFGAFFTKALDGEAKNIMLGRLDARLAFLNTHLQKSAFMLGNEFSVVDAYVYNIIRWASPLKVDITKYPAIMGLMEKVSARPAVRASVEAEGLKV
jgi:glutathione S-transferase